MKALPDQQKCYRCCTVLIVGEKRRQSTGKLGAIVEKALSHESVVVKCNPKEYADNGVQLAEFDVVVEGRIGSSDVRILLECRDRPSDGAAPGAWIDQMVGRRSTYNFSRVVAVSTTGFSPGAVLSAERNNIELRVIEKTDAESIRSWFFPGKILLRQVKDDSLDVKIFPRQPKLSSFAKQRADCL
jgi:hypothetical protein